METLAAIIAGLYALVCCWQWGLEIGSAFGRGGDDQ